ncbi:hypothetical protein SLS55_009959 [Diplodia seriata]|uniref:Uncharacterized protein n=1 Tax=Diplodia seriata TaxID=420778 RepID=A0ABR3C4Q3_9PEZI
MAEELKGRRRSQPLEDKWRAIWGILFPSDPEHEIPPPWWVNRDELQGLDFYDRFQTFMHEDLPSRVTQSFYTFVDQLFISGLFQGQIEAIVHNCLEQSYALFRAHDTAGQADTPPPPPPPRQHEAGASVAAAAAPSASAGPSTATTSFAMPNSATAAAAPGHGVIDPSLVMPGRHTDDVHNFQSDPWPTATQDGGLTPPAFDVPGLSQTQQPGSLASLLPTHGSTHPEMSFLAVERDGSATHTPVGRSPDWTNIDSIDFNGDFDDLTSMYHASFPRRSQEQGGSSSGRG